MKTLKKSILSRSSHSGEGFKTQRRNEIEKWLKEYDIENYTINDDFTIDVDGNVNLFRKNLKELPDYIQFDVVRGNFVYTDNNLISLRGCPREVGKSFYCDINKLTSLEGAPEKVGEKFDCNCNNLTSLEGAPEKVGVGFYCSSNRLTSLEGGPKEVGEMFNCENNNIRTLDGLPKKINGDFYGNYIGAIPFTKEDIKNVCDISGHVYFYRLRK